MRAAICAAMLAAALWLPAVVRAQELVLHKEGTTLYHRPACDVVRAGEGVLAMTRAQAEGRGLKPHADCDLANTPAGAASRAVPAPPVFVYMDRGTLYHREGCARLGRAPRKVALEDAARKAWPCPKCRPPIRKIKKPA